jgi:D-alanyl-D-alanine endopeptidase (penicillin-binding protein 7)
VRHRVSTARVHYRAAAINADTPTALRSGAVMILDPASGAVLFEKNSAAPMPIASLTKLMTALVVVEAKQDMDEAVTVTDDDVDRLKHSSSRLRVGTRLTRAAMLHIALMSSENRAASALGRHFPGGRAAFVAAMNAKAASLGMLHTHYVEPTGLSSANVSTAEDLSKLVVAAQREPLIRAYSTDHDYTIRQGGRPTPYRNTNRLISNASWDIGLQKTGYINEAGRCMVLHATIKGRAVVMVFLDAQGKFSRAADANRVRAWLTSAR